LEESFCKGNCGFTYLASLTNNVTLPAITTYLYANDVTITGNNLTNAVVKVG
jgi:hypothetical protein